MLIAGLAGALLGGHLGAMNWSSAGVRRALGIILALAVSIYWFKL